MRYLALFLFAFVACNGSEPPPPPPPPPECELTPADCNSGRVDLEACECIPIEPPPPPPPPPVTGCDVPASDRVDEDYIPLDRADHWQRELRVMDQRLINNGVRNPFFALTNCPSSSPASVWPYNGIDEAEAGDVIDRATEVKRALTGDDGESGFYARVAEQHPTRREGRSRVYRPCFTVYWHEARELADGCAERDDEGTCTLFNPSTRPNGPVSRLDGVKGACQTNLEAQ